MTSGEEIRRYKLTVHYDGRDFHGWQVQPDVRTVQGEIEAAVRRLTGRRRPVVGSGRTDTGVHATGQVASVDLPLRWSAAEFHRAMNAVLPRDVWLSGVRTVRGDFHPRYDALRRTYVYRLGTAPVTRSPFHRWWCWSLAGDVDAGLLAEGAARMEGTHSFSAFAKAGQPERGDRCTVHRAVWEPWEELGHAFTITADRYLHHMVRYLVGTMVDAARGRRPVEDLGALLNGEPGTGLETSPPAPPEGLFLARVEYPVEDDADRAPSATNAPGTGVDR